ncbi:hypothetical protein Peur_013337 [Populus x canadensis]
MLPAFSISWSKMIEQWKKMVNHQESCEVDVWPELQKLTMDIISRAAFGSNYEEGKRLFELQKELIFFGFGSYADLVHSRFQICSDKKESNKEEIEQRDHDIKLRLLCSYSVFHIFFPMMMMNKEIVSMIRDLIQRKQYGMRTGQSDDDDLLGMLLQSNDRTIYQKMQAEQ